MSFIFHNVFYRPLLNILGLLTYILPGQSFGGSIILLTILVNAILLPLTHRAKHSQRKLQELQPEFERIRREFKNKREEQARRQLELYREHGINPLTTVLLPFIQIPLFIALFKVLRKQGDIFTADVYSFLPPFSAPGRVFLKFFDLSLPGIVFHISPEFVFVLQSLPNVLLALAAAILQYWQLALLTPPSMIKDESFGTLMQQSMRINLPIIIFILGSTLPAALTLYWTVMSLFGIVHEGVVLYSRRTASEDYGNGTKPTKRDGN